ncbi:hypothetical protein VTO73DRAFT_2039 [Trametes versicolor]
MPRKTHPRAYLPYKLRPSSFRIGAPLRPRDLAARPKAPRQPTLPAELFSAALLDADNLGLECLRHQAPLHNIALRIHAEEIRGAVEGIFQDPSTFKLHLTVEPVMFMRPLKVVLAEFVGDECQYSAPTWLSRLWRAENKSAQRVRSYEWVITYVYGLLATPGLELPAQEAWEELLRVSANFVHGHISEDRQLTEAGRALRPRLNRRRQHRRTSGQSEWELRFPPCQRPVIELYPTEATPLTSTLLQDDEAVEPAYDDGWEDCEDDGAEAPPYEQHSAAEGTEPPGVGRASPGPPGFTLAAGNPDTAASAIRPDAPRCIPLDATAMASLGEDDPFFSLPVLVDTRWSTFSLSHPSVVLAMLLAAWLHLSAHLPFRFCDALLSIIGLILAEAGQGHLVPDLRSSLSGCLAALRLEPSFKVYPTCPDCLEPHPECVAAHADTRCTACGHPLFKIETGRARGRGGKKRAKPYLRTPAKSITEQLADLLVQPGMEDAMEGWRRRSRIPGWLSDFFDGEISKSLLGPDGLPFFRHEGTDPEDELRIGVALGIDWYRASNLLLSMIIPGPKETDPDQTQRYVRVLVNELIRLWHHGIILPTHKHPRGRRIRVILVGVFCDKPAAHKLGGFGSHAHTFFCTRDWISQKFKATCAAFIKGAFADRTDTHHRRMMNEYRNFTTKNARDDYAKAYATRWSELARLPYFDLCRMVVVDPMHNLFLGVVKTHFYHIWIQLKLFRKSKELRQLHDILGKLSLPSKLGRLPRLVGEPAGGSLTADQWLILATVVGPLALPQLWEGINDDEMDDDFLDRRRISLRETVVTRKAQQKARSSRASNRGRRNRKPAATNTPEVAEAVRRSSRARKPSEKGAALVLEADDAGAVVDEDDDSWINEDDNDSTRGSQLHPRDLSNFLKLCAAVRLFLADRLNESQLDEADKLVREYCTELIELYGPEVIRPNHHYATHTADFVRDYGPLRGFWTFLFERLNKILKSYRTNNHEGGEIETTFFREFHRSMRLHRTLTEGILHPLGSCFNTTSQIMLKATTDNRGTLQQLADELDAEFQDDEVALSFSPRSARERMPNPVYYALITYMNTRYPLQPFHSDIALATNPISKLLPNIATVFDYAVVGGQRYHAATRASTSVNSLALIRVSGAGATWIGETQYMILYEDVHAGVREAFAYVQWLRPAAASSLTGTPWAGCPETFALQSTLGTYYRWSLVTPSPSTDSIFGLRCHWAAQ